MDVSRHAADMASHRISHLVADLHCLVPLPRARSEAKKGMGECGVLVQCLPFLGSKTSRILDRGGQGGKKQAVGGGEGGKGGKGKAKGCDGGGWRVEHGGGRAGRSVRGDDKRRRTASSQDVSLESLSHPYFKPYSSICLFPCMQTPMAKADSPAACSLTCLAAHLL